MRKIDFAAVAMLLALATIVVAQPTPTTPPPARGGLPPGTALTPVEEAILAELRAIRAQSEANGKAIENLQKGQDAQSKQFGEFRTEVIGKLATMDGRIVSIEGKVDKMDTRLSNIETIVARLDSRVTSLESEVRAAACRPAACTACAPCTCYSRCYVRIRRVDCTCGCGGYYNCAGYVWRVVASPCGCYYNWHLGC